MTKFDLVTIRRTLKVLIVISYLIGSVYYGGSFLVYLREGGVQEVIPYRGEDGNEGQIRNHAAFTAAWTIMATYIIVFWPRHVWFRVSRIGAKSIENVEPLSETQELPVIDLNTPRVPERQNRWETIRRIAIAMAEKNGDSILAEIEVESETTYEGLPKLESELDGRNPAITQTDGGRYYLWVREDGRGQIDINWPSGLERTLKFWIPEKYLVEKTVSDTGPVRSPAPTERLKVSKIEDQAQQEVDSSNSSFTKNNRHKVSRSRPIIKNIVGFFWLIGMIAMSLLDLLGFWSVGLVVIAILWGSFGFWFLSK
ncbi:hypothetical protein N9Y63_08225 [Akkermansiaceae bacterium]|nr:hypothetical protein [Akkermansiaceae bacterium]